MKAIRIGRFGDSSVMTAENVKVPQAEAGEVLEVVRCLQDLYSPWSLPRRGARTVRRAR
jgi:hypothetical protein